MRLSALAAVGLFLAGLLVPAFAGPPPLGLTVLSSRPDLVSGGDALIEVTGATSPVTLVLNGRPALVLQGRSRGLVAGLALGRNELVATAPGRPSAHLTLVNHPIGGPLFSGPQVQPWICQKGATDAQCDAPAQYSYASYNPVTRGFDSYNPARPPANVPTTTTDQGVTVPFVIRIETGYLDRDQYKIATLFDPAKPWTAWAPQPQWNHKVLITHGASCGDDHTTGTAPSVASDIAGDSPTMALSRGFAVMSTAMDNAGHDCNIVTEAESLIMAKEHLVKSYGEIRYTIGTGCSGGSLTQQQVANAYPGVYQGILPQCSFPDAWSTGQQLEDYVLLRRYFENPLLWGTGVGWTPAQIAAVEGHPDHLNAVELSTLYGPLPDPQAPCAGVTAAQRWSPANTHGVRCSLQDYMINVFGARPQDGYAGRAYANVGVQYGLDALLNGSISPSQFADLNRKTGSHDINYGWQPTRVAADQFAVVNGYRSGAFNETNNMSQVAIIDLRGPDPGAFHDSYRAFAVRARLQREHGTFANQVIWQGLAPIVGDVDYTTQGLLAMDRWVGAFTRDRRALPLARKIIEDKPADIHDQCSNGVGQVVPFQVCQAVVQIYGTPRIVAGEPITTDTATCQLRPLTRSDYHPVQLTDAEWTTIRSEFPSGVCDYTKPGVGQQPTVPWQTYQNGPGTGHPLPSVGQ